MIQKAATVRVAIAVAVLAGVLTLHPTSAQTKKPEASAPQLTNASLTLDCRTGEAIHSYAVVRCLRSVGDSPHVAGGLGRLTGVKEG
jgi:hypothetical protein